MGLCGSTVESSLPGDGTVRPRPDISNLDNKFPRMTRAALNKKREEFWETRLEGRPEMWQAIRLAVQAEDEATQHSIMQAAGLTPWDWDRVCSAVAVISGVLLCPLTAFLGTNLLPIHVPLFGCSPCSPTRSSATTSWVTVTTCLCGACGTRGT